MYWKRAPMHWNGHDMNRWGWFDTSPKPPTPGPAEQPLAERLARAVTEH
ncbi:hypothetical protein [Streptomyces sp. NPDC048419]